MERLADRLGEVSTLPGRTRPGLIEAGTGGRSSPRPAPLFRGVLAPASLKLEPALRSHDPGRPPALPGQTRPGLIEATRPPSTDPINALLSFTYSLAVRTFTVALETAGLDPLLGFFHRPRPARPALALDMMEPFRPILCDSTVLMVINNGEVRDVDFVRNGPACAMKPSGRRALIGAWERRLDQEAVHPVFGYRISMRRIVAVQCRLLARHLLGEIPRIPHYTPR